MIELPEAIVISRQIQRQLAGKRILSASRASAPYQFVFYSRSVEDYRAILPGKVIQGAAHNGSLILVTLEPGYVLALGYGGEQILYHASGTTLPEKHSLCLQFTNQTFLTVSVQGWGYAKLLTRAETALDPYAGRQAVMPLSPDFTRSYFLRLFDCLEDEDRRSIKTFLINTPGIWGLGSGCLHDILFNAKIHPQMRAVDLDKAERVHLYETLCTTLEAMVVGGGRDTEVDLFAQPGEYRKILKSTSAGTPCQRCGTPIVKAPYLGGMILFCPTCQVSP